MFIKRSELMNLHERIQTLETYAERDYNRAEQHTARIKDLESTVGDSRSTSGLSMLMERYYQLDPEPEMTISDKINQIMDHLGLVVKRTEASTRIAKKPEPAKRAPAAKARKR